MGRALFVRWFVLTLSLLAWRAEAQFSFSTNNNQLTITGYSGPGGNVSLPDNSGGLPVTAVAMQACWFNSNIANLTITNTAITISNQAFYRCYVLTNIFLGPGVTNIALSAFGFDQSLLNISVDPLNTFYASVGGVLFDQNQATLLQCPGGYPGGYTVPNSVTTIASNAFQYCTAITSVVVPDSVTAIQDSAFSNCGLTNIALGTNVGTIEGSAFLQSQLLSITLPASVTNIGFVPFRFCLNLPAINVDSANPAYTGVDGMLLDKAQLNVIQCAPGKTGTCTLPATVTNLGTYAFAGCRATNLIVPNGLLAIGNSCFNGSSFKTFDFPDSLANVAASAFFVSPITNVTFGTGLTNLGDYALSSCSFLQAIRFRGNAPTLGGPFVFSSDGGGVGRAPVVYYAPGTTGWSNTFGGLATKMWDPVSQCVVSVSNNTVTVTGYIGGSNVLTIPSAVKGMPVTAIANSAFQNSQITSVTIPGSITNVGVEAFRNCTALRTVQLSKVGVIGDSAFYNCTALTNIDLSGVTNIGSLSFYGCTNLTSIHFNPALTNLGQAAFDNCTGLRGSIIVPAGVRTMYATFTGCTNLTAIYFLGNAPSATVPFSGDNNLTVYYLPGKTGWTNTLASRPAVLWNPQAAQPAWHPNGFSFNITGNSNISVVVEASPSLASPAWTPIATNTLTSGTTAFIDPATNVSRRYYRFRNL